MDERGGGDAEAVDEPWVSSSSCTAADPRRVGGKIGGGADTFRSVCEGLRDEVRVLRRLQEVRREGKGFS